MPRNRKPTVRKRERHLRKLIIAPEAFINLTPGAVIKVTGSPIKEGTRLVGAGYEHGLHAFVLVLEHDDFPPVHLGNVIPVGGDIDFLIIEREKPNDQPNENQE
jgi:hypothetical protein